MAGRRSLALSLVSLGLCSAFRAPAARAVVPRATLATSSNAAAPEGPPPLRVGIIGAGPAGLSVALCLRQLLGEGGVELAVFDRSDQLRPALGGGVQLNSGAAVLARLGLADALLARGRPAARVVSRNVAREVLLDLDLHAAIRARDAAAEGGTGLVTADGRVLAVTVMRDALQQMLAAELPDDVFRFGRELRSVESVAGGAAARCAFTDGSSEDFDLVVGADGIRSKARDAVLGSGAAGGLAKTLGLGDPSYTGIRIAWAVGPGGARPKGAEGELHQWFGPGAYCLSAEYGGRDGPADQCVLVYADDPSVGERDEAVAAAVMSAGTKLGATPAVNDAWAEGSTDAALRDMRERIAAAGMPEEVRSLAASCDRVFELGSYFVNPLLPWAGLGGRCVLVGDAAHAMPPFLGQGTNQAIQDAWCLAEQLAELRSGAVAPGAGREAPHASLSDALGAYERARKVAAARLTLNSRVLGLVETGVPPAGRDAFFRTTGALGVAKFVFLDGAVPKV